jgi:nicotinamidase/pyrazinamidase
MGYGMQTLWPDHCIQGSKGAEFHPALRLPQAQLILRKGFRPQIDSYSAFFENDRSTATGLAGYLRERNLIRVFLAGLAYDFCVGDSALDARRLGFEAIILLDACRAIDLNGSVEKIESEFAEAGVVLMDSADVINDADVEEAIRQGQEDASQGKIRPAKEFFDEFETTHPELE